jgi:hypothetical protein
MDERILRNRSSVHTTSGPPVPATEAAVIHVSDYHMFVRLRRELRSVTPAVSLNRESSWTVISRRSVSVRCNRENCGIKGFYGAGGQCVRYPFSGPSENTKV